MKKILLCLSLLLLVFGQAILLAEEDSEATQEKRRNKIVNLEDEAEKAKREKDWVKAIAKYKKIRETLKRHTNLYSRRTLEEKGRDAIYNLGFCYLQGALAGQGDKNTYLKEAKTNLDVAWHLAPEQGEAYFYVAKIFAIYYQEKGTDTKEGRALYEQVKEKMKQAAENGYNVFVGINQPDSHLEFLKKDAKFIMDILKAAKNIDINDVNKLPNPFHPKFDLYFQNKGGEGMGEEDKIPDLGNQRGFATNVDEQKKLLQNIEKTFLQLKNMVEKDSGESPKPEVIQLWQKLQKLLKRKDDIFIPRFQKKLAEVTKNLSEMQERLEKVQLAYYYNLGNGVLKDMRKSFVRRNYRQVIRHWGKLRELAREMANSGNENFRKTAESLLNSGQNFEKQAQTYLKLASIKHEVTGIIIEKFPRKQRVAIVNNHPYFEGEFILDTKGEPMELKIKKIEFGKVTFVYKGVEVPEFLRE